MVALLSLLSVFSSTRFDPKARIFELEYGGHRSYLVATNHFVANAEATRFLERILPDTCGVLLEGGIAPRNGFDQDDLAGSRYLTGALSGEGLDIYTDITDRDGMLVPLSLKPGAALGLLRERYGARVSALARTVTVDDYLSAPVPADLRRLSQALFGGGYLGEAESRVDRAAEIIRRGEGLDYAIIKMARDRSLPAAKLDAPDLERRMRLENVSVAELERALRAADRRLKPEAIAQTVRANALAAVLLVELMERFFEMDARTIGAGLRTVGPYLDPVGASQVAGVRQLTGRHAGWMDDLMRELGDGPRLIAVGAAHVINGFSPHSGTPLVDLLRARGVSVRAVELDR